MHYLAAILLGLSLVSCATAPESYARSADARRDFEQLTAGKIAGAPLTCVPGTNLPDLQIIDGRTVAYRLGSRTTYIVQLSQGCGGLAHGYTLVTEHFGGAGPCRGDVARVVDLTSRIPIGSCIVKDIVPYNRAG